MTILKKIIIILFLIIFIFWNIAYHKAVLIYNKFSKNHPYIANIFYVKNDYVKYFFYHDVTPLYTFKNDILTKYQKYSFSNKKNWLIFLHQKTLADLKYIQDIQYLASFKNTYEAKQLYSELNYVTNLAPYRAWIYTLWLLIIPAWSKMAQKLSFIEKIVNRKNTVKLWEKWIFFNCDKDKIENILNLSNDNFFKLAYAKTWELYKKLSNPCKTSDLPQQLWFDYFYYLKDLKKSVKYYKVASFFKDSLTWIIWMVAIVNWMLWEHEKWIYLLLTRASSIYKKLNTKLPEKEKKIYENSLKSTIKRAEVELNYYIINQADNNHKECNKQYSCLEKKGYINTEIIKLLNECKKIFSLYKIKTLNDLFSKNISYSIENAKCFLLWLNIQNGYIQNWKLKTIFYTGWTYYWNTRLQTWWEK